MKFEVNIEKKYFLGLFVIVLMLVGVFAVNAYGTYNPEVFGHTSSEVDVVGNWFIPYFEDAPEGEGSYKLGFGREDGGYVYVGYEVDNTPQLQIIGSEFERGVGGGLEVHGDSDFVDSEVRADDFCFDGGCLSDLEFKCTYAKRDYRNPDEIFVLDGDEEAVKLWGEPESGNDDAYWGLACDNGYKKTSCHYWALDVGGGEYDTFTTDGNNCLTDDEEFDAGGVVGIGCCTIGF